MSNGDLLTEKAGNVSEKWDGARTKIESEDDVTCSLVHEMVPYAAQHLFLLYFL